MAEMKRRAFLSALAAVPFLGTGLVQERTRGFLVRRAETDITGNRNLWTASLLGIEFTLDDDNQWHRLAVLHDHCRATTMVKKPKAWDGIVVLPNGQPEDMKDHVPHGGWTDLKVPLYLMWGSTIYMPSEPRDDSIMGAQVVLREFDDHLGEWRTWQGGKRDGVQFYDSWEDAMMWGCERCGP